MKDCRVQDFGRHLDPISYGKGANRELDMNEIIPRIDWNFVTQLNWA